MINENLVKKYMNICLEFINETICDMTKIRKEFEMNSDKEWVLKLFWNFPLKMKTKFNINMSYKNLDYVICDIDIIIKMEDDVREISEKVFQINLNLENDDESKLCESIDRVKIESLNYISNILDDIKYYLVNIDYYKEDNFKEILKKNKDIYYKISEKARVSEFNYVITDKELETYTCIEKIKRGQSEKYKVLSNPHNLTDDQIALVIDGGELLYGYDTNCGYFTINSSKEEKRGIADSTHLYYYWE